MKTVYVDLSNINNIKKFVEMLCRYDGDFDLIQGKYVIDAKSIVGIFSLDLSKPIQMNIEKENPVLDEELRIFMNNSSKNI